MSDLSEKEMTGMLKSLAIFLLLSTFIGIAGITNEPDQFVGDRWPEWIADRIDPLTVDAHVVERGWHKYTLEKDFSSAPCADILPHLISEAKH
jgi:hypothetical protein